MTLEYSGHEEAPAGRDAVWAFVTDPASIAACIPEMVESSVIDGRTAEVYVAGPMRMKLKLRIALDPEPDRHRLGITIAGGAFGSAVDATVLAGFAPLGDGATAVEWTSTVTVRGAIATVGRHVIDVQAQRVITTMFANIKARLGATSPISRA